MTMTQEEIRDIFDRRSTAAIERDREILESARLSLEASRHRTALKMIEGI